MNDCGAHGALARRGSSARRLRSPRRACAPRIERGASGNEQAGIAYPRAQTWTAPVVIVAGTVALAARVQSAGALAVVAVVGLAAAAVPLLPSTRTVRRARSAAVLALGVVAFAVVGVAWPSPSRNAGLAAAAGGVVAAVAEEAFFRRLVYGWLERLGTQAAIAGAAALFAAVHVRAYGPGVLTLDAAAGLLLCWQRWATGSWTVPAATHVAANLLVSW